MTCDAIRGVAALAALAVGVAIAAPAAAQDVPVDLELVLAVDVSGSMDSAERQLQRDGYVQAFLHPDVIAAIGSGFYGRIAVSYVEWAGPRSQSMVMPWRLVDGRIAAESVAAELAAARSPRIRGKSISAKRLQPKPSGSRPSWKPFRRPSKSRTFRRRRNCRPPRPRSRFHRRDVLSCHPICSMSWTKRWPAWNWTT